MKLMSKMFALAVVAGAIATSAQAITFSNFNYSGNLSAGTSAIVSSLDVDFITPSAAVGDGKALRNGVLVITYEAFSSTPILSDKIVISLLGGLSGSGNILFNEVVEDISDPMNIITLGTDSTTLQNQTQLPYTSVINFSRPSSHIKVKKTFVLDAQDSANPLTLDLAQIALVEQTFEVVPEPATMAFVALGAAAVIRRRKK